MTTSVWTNGIGGLFARLGTFVLALLAAGLLSSCSCGFNVLNSFRSDPKVAFATETMVNNTSAVAVDVVLVYDEALIEPLLALSAKDWFATREQLRNDYPDRKKSYEVWPLELVPGQDTTLTIRRIRCAETGIVFADYFAQGEHRARFEKQRLIQVVLGERGFKLADSSGESSENP